MIKYGIKFVGLTQKKLQFKIWEMLKPKNHILVKSPQRKIQPVSGLKQKNFFFDIFFFFFFLTESFLNKKKKRFMNAIVSISKKKISVFFRQSKTFYCCSSIFFLAIFDCAKFFLINFF